jgi:hypothetical protein
MFGIAPTAVVLFSKTKSVLIRIRAVVNGPGVKNTRTERNV